MRRLDETHGTLFELIRHFLSRMFDSDLFSSAGQGKTVATGAFALVIPVGMLVLDPSYAAKYRLLSHLGAPDAFRAAAVADLLSLSTLIYAIVGLVAILQWQSLFPGKRDFLALAGLPVLPRQVFTARILSVLVFSIGIIIAINILPSLLVPLQFTGKWQKNSSYIANAVAHGVSVGLGSAFVVAFIMAVQGVLLNLLPGRLFARVSVWVQGAFTAVLLFAGLFSPSIGNWSRDQIALLPQLGTWAPPVWFAGLHEAMLGDKDLFYSVMAQRALLGLAAVIAVVVITYLLAFRRYQRLLLEAPDQGSSPRKRRWSLTRLLAGDPRQEAILEFMRTTLARSRTHRLVLLAYLGGTLGFLINSALLSAGGTERGHDIIDWRYPMRVIPALWPLAASAVALAGMQHVFKMPVELRANWIFRMSESHGRERWMAAVERFVLCFTILPIHLALFPVSAWVFGWLPAAKMTVLQVLVSLTFFEYLFRTWQQLPFTCSYLPGKRPVIAILASYLVVLGAIVPILSAAIGTASQSRYAYWLVLALFIVVWLCTRQMRRDGWGEAPLYYEDLAETVPDIGIRDVAFHHPSTT